MPNVFQSFGLPPELQAEIARRAQEELNGQRMPIDLLPPGFNAPVNNAMQQTALPPDAPQPAPIPQDPINNGMSGQEAPRQRRSLLDTIGRVSDVLARVGGAEPLYQPTLDAFEDRTRAIDMDMLRQQLAEQQVNSGDLEMTGQQNAMLGQAVRGLRAIQARGGDINSAWPILAQQVGIPEDQISQLGQIFTSDPNALEGFAAMLSEPRAQGSPSSAVQNFQAYQQILADQGEDAARQFLSLAQPASQVQPYQQAQLSQRELDRQSREQQAEANRDVRLQTAEIAADTRREIADRARSRAQEQSLTPTQRGSVRQALAALPATRQTLNRVRELARQMRSEGTTSRGRLGGLIPGQIAGGTAEQFDRAASLLMSRVRQITRTAGEGSMSDYESRLAAATVPSRWGTDAGRAEALRNLDQLLNDIERESRTMLAPAENSSPRRNESRTDIRRPPRIGQTRRGFRFIGGAPARFPSAWERVN